MLGHIGGSSSLRTSLSKSGEFKKNEDSLTQNNHDDLYSSGQQYLEQLSEFLEVEDKLHSKKLTSNRTRFSTLSLSNEFMEAVKLGNLDKMISSLKTHKNISVNFKDENGFSALHWTVMYLSLITDLLGAATSNAFVIC